MWESAYPPQLNQGGSAFIYPPAQGFLGISDGFSWSIFKHAPPPSYRWSYWVYHRKTHALDKSARRPSCWHSGNTLETDTAIALLVFFFFFGKLMNLVVSTSVARNVCNEIFYSKSKNAITRLAAGSANIIMLQQILDERFTFLHPLVRRFLLPQAGCELYSGRDCCLLKSYN